MPLPFRNRKNRKSKENNQQSKTNTNASTIPLSSNTNTNTNTGPSGSNGRNRRRGRKAKKNESKSIETKSIETKSNTVSVTTTSSDPIDKIDKTDKTASSQVPVPVEDGKCSPVKTNNATLSPTHTLSTSGASSTTLSDVCIDDSNGNSNNNDNEMNKEDNHPKHFVPQSSESNHENKIDTNTGDTSSRNHPPFLPTLGDERTKCSDDDKDNEGDAVEQTDGHGIKPIPRTLVSIGHSLHLWMSDMDKLLTSTVFQNAIQSTLKLTTNVSKAVIQITLYPLVKPIQMTTNMIHSSISLFHQSTLSLTNAMLGLKKNNTLQSKTHNNHDENENSDNNSNGNNSANIGQSNTMPSLYQTTEQLITSSLSLFFGQTTHLQRQIQAKREISSHTSTTACHYQVLDEIDEGNDSDYLPLVYDDNVEETGGNHNTSEQHLEISTVEDLEHKDVDNNAMVKRHQIEDQTQVVQSTQCHRDDDHEMHLQNQSETIIYCVRVSDLDISNKKLPNSMSNVETSTVVSSIEEKKEEIKSSSNSNDERVLVLQLTLPSLLMNDLNTQAIIIGAMNAMVEIGLDLLLNSNGEMSWHEEGSTVKLLKGINANLTKEVGQLWYENSNVMTTLEKESLLWSGCRKPNSPGSASSYAPKTPMFRGRGVIPSMGPKQLTEILFDSTKVGQYNKWSKGRSDLAVFQDDIGGSTDNPYGVGALKIVESETRVPLSNSTITMTSLIHGRPIALDHTRYCLDNFDTSNPNPKKQQHLRNGYVMVSRTVSKVEGGKLGDMNKGNDNADMLEYCKNAQNEIIWGVNLFLEIPGHRGKTEMITLTQAKSSAVPNFLVNKVGIMGAGDFFKNIRNMKVK